MVLNRKQSGYARAGSEPLCYGATSGRPCPVPEGGFDNHKCTEFGDF